MKQLDLKPVGLTDRMEHNATAANFAQIEDAFNSNAITAEEMYAELNDKLAAEAKARKAGDDREANARKAGDDNEARDRRVADKELDGKITAEAQARAEADKELDDKITAEAQARVETDQGLEQRIARLERYIFDGQPVFVDNLFPPQKSNGSIEVADDGEVTPAPSNVVDGEVRDTPTNIFVK